MARKRDTCLTCGAPCAGGSGHCRSCYWALRRANGNATKQCSVTTCKNTVKALGLCNKHYRRRLLYGSPHVVHTRRPCAYCGATYQVTSPRQHWCPTCVPSREARARMQRYGISEPEYRELLARQGDRCAICRETCGTGESLAVDHAHGSKIVRGLLCRRCNMILHYVEHPTLLVAAERYLHPPPAS